MSRDSSQAALAFGSGDRFNGGVPQMMQYGDWQVCVHYACVVVDR